MAKKKQQSETKSSKPTFYAYHVRDVEDKGYFTRIGAAFPHKDGKGFSILIDTLPRDGRITLRVPMEKSA